MILSLCRGLQELYKMKEKLRVPEMESTNWPLMKSLVNFISGILKAPPALPLQGLAMEKTSRFLSTNRAFLLPRISLSSLLFAVKRNGSVGLLMEFVRFSNFLEKKIKTYIFHPRKAGFLTKIILQNILFPKIWPFGFYLRI